MIKIDNEITNVVTADRVKIYFSENFLRLYKDCIITVDDKNDALHIIYGENSDLAIFQRDDVLLIELSSPKTAVIDSQGNVT